MHRGAAARRRSDGPDVLEKSHRRSRAGGRSRINTATAVVLLVSATGCASSAKSSTERVVVTTTVMTATSTSATTSTTSPSPFEVRWDLTTDFARHPADNPFGHAVGGPAVWSLRQSASLDRTGTYPQLPTYSRAFVRGVAAWHGDNEAC